MASVRFNLRSKASDKPQPIYLIFRHQGKRLMYAVGFSVKPKHWDDSNQRVRNITEVTDKDRINNLLNSLKSETMRFAAEMLEQRDFISMEKVREHLDIFTNKKKYYEKSLFGFIESFIENSHDRLLPSGKKVSYRTIQKYQTTFDRLKEFAKRSKRVVDFDTIDLDFYNDFVKDMQDENFSTNNIGKYIETLKTFLNEATARGLNKNMQYKSRYFRAIREESDNIYLNEKDLLSIYDLDLSEHPRLDRVRDLFIIGSWTGLRFSDFTQISKENIKGEFLEIVQYKTGDPVIIPLHSTVKSILDKYSNELPKGISNQKMNDYIKEVCKMAGLTEKVQKAITKGGVKRITTHEKWGLVSTHTARRSFATNLYKSGFPSISIMQITGHKMEKNFLKYIKVTPNEHAKLLAMHWSKSNSKLKVIK